MDLSEGAHNNILMLSEFFETDLQDGSLEVIAKRASSCVFIFTCIYQQRYTKRLFLVETARSVPKFYHCAPVKGGGGGGTPIYGLYRYVPRNRVSFLRFSVLK